MLFLIVGVLHAFCVGYSSSTYCTCVSYVRIMPVAHKLTACAMFICKHMHVESSEFLLYDFKKCLSAAGVDPH